MGLRVERGISRDRMEIDHHPDARDRLEVRRLVRRRMVNSIRWGMSSRLGELSLADERKNPIDMPRKYSCCKIIATSRVFGTLSKSFLLRRRGKPQGER